METRGRWGMWQGDGSGEKEDIAKREVKWTGKGERVRADVFKREGSGVKQ